MIPPRKGMFHKIKSPCYGCEERSAECHGKCERYAEWKDQIEAEKQKAEKVYSGDRTHYDYVVKRKLAMKKAKEKQQ